MCAKEFEWNSLAVLRSQTSAIFSTASKLAGFFLLRGDLWD